jgi:predicted nucleic acid-binding protein
MADPVKAVLDACVLYPPVLRDLLLGVAAQRLFTPLWSDRILEEWARATMKLGQVAELQARGEIALIRAAFPKACLPAAPSVESRLVLPDENDLHVLATAISGGADAIITFNAQDFPRHVLAEEGIARRDPDGFLWEMWSHHPNEVDIVVTEVHATAERLAGKPVSLKSLLKRAQLPRFAKALQAS